MAGKQKARPTPEPPAGRPIDETAIGQLVGKRTSMAEVEDLFGPPGGFQKHSPVTAFPADPTNPNHPAVIRSQCR